MRRQSPQFRLFREALAGVPSLTRVYTPLLVVQTLLCIAIPFATGAFLDALISHGRPLRPFAALALLSLLRMLLSPALQRYVMKASRLVERRLQDKVLDRLLGLSPAKTEALPYGELVAKVIRDAGAMGAFVRSFYPRLVVALATLLAASASLCFKSTVLGLAFLLLIPASCFLFRPYSRKFQRVSHAVRARSDGAFNNLFEFFHVLPFLQMLAAERPFAGIPRQALDRVQRENGFSQNLGVGFDFALSSLLVLGEVFVLGFSGMLAWNGRIPPGDVVVYQMLFLTAVQAIQGVVCLLPEVSTIREGVQSLCELLDGAPSGNIGRTGLSAIRGLACRDVSFTYPNAAEPVLYHYSASIPDGAIVGISGANGAGKTTLLKLLMGALVPTDGAVMVNGMSVASVSEKEYRKRIGAVFQDNLLFTGTILENVTLRNPDYGDAELREALALSGADAVVARMPCGLLTRIGNGGQSLSGGERQKIAIARALIRNPDLLVLDEVTNHLDMDSRAAFCGLLDRFRGRKTVLLVSHDPDVLRRCDFRVHLQREDMS